MFIRADIELRWFWESFREKLRGCTALTHLSQPMTNVMGMR